MTNIGKNVKIKSIKVERWGKNVKSTGIVRKIDELGRIVLPMEIRNTLNLEPKDSIEIFVEEDKIILKKYQPCCIFCKSTKNNVIYDKKLVCKSCIEKLKKQL